MRGVLLGCVLLAGCEAAGASAVHVRPIGAAPPGCELIATLRQAEGGGLASLAENRAIARGRLQEEAWRLHADGLELVEELHGTSDEGQRAFANGVAGLTTPSARCTNCVQLTARAFQCAHPLARRGAMGPPASPGDDGS